MTISEHIRVFFYECVVVNEFYATFRALFAAFFPRSNSFYGRAFFTRKRLAAVFGGTNIYIFFFFIVIDLLKFNSI